MGFLLSRGFCTPYADEGVPALVAVLINPTSCRRLVIPFIGATLVIPGDPLLEALHPRAAQNNTSARGCHLASYTTCSQNAEYPTYSNAE